MAAALINYEIPWTKDNEEAMKNAALEKYGQVSEQAMYPVWCDKPIPGTGMGCESDSAKIEVSGTKLSFIDPAWRNAVIQFRNQQQATKPQF